LAELTRDLPSNVSEFVYRRVDCNHWAGEDPYDEERREQIKKALGRLRCDVLEQDEIVLRKHVAGNSRALGAIEAARDLVW
jgi:hypothetical protein